MHDKSVNFLKGTGIKKPVDSLACKSFPSVVLFFCRCFSTTPSDFLTKRKKFLPFLHPTPLLQAFIHLLGIEALMDNIFKFFLCNQALIRDGKRFNPV